jgi:tripartite-type tricarboxylate transporter receptor subunit TctC
MHHLLALIAATLAFASVSPAQAASGEYPARPVRMIVPYPPGGGSDITGRAIGNKLTE